MAALCHFKFAKLWHFVTILSPANPGSPGKWPLKRRASERVSCDRPWKHNLSQRTKFHWNRMILGWDTVIKPLSKWRPSAILIFENWYFGHVIVLIPTKYCVNRTINCWGVAEKQFSIWWPSAIMNLQNVDTLSCDHHWKHNLRVCTIFYWNHMIPGWDIAIKLFSKWRPYAILIFQKLVFWSRVLCLNVILLLSTKFCVNQTINRCDIAEKQFSICQPSGVLNLQKFAYCILSVSNLESKICICAPNFIEIGSIVAEI